MKNPFPWFKAEEKQFTSVQPSTSRKDGELSLDDVLALEAT